MGKLERSEACSILEQVFPDWFHRKTKSPIGLCFGVKQLVEVFQVLLEKHHVLLGFGEALGTPAYSAIFAEYLDLDKHIRNYIDWKLISNLLRSVAVILGGILVDKAGFAPLFYLMGVLGLISFFGIWMTPREIL